MKRLANRITRCEIFKSSVFLRVLLSGNFMQIKGMSIWFSVRLKHIEQMNKREFTSNVPATRLFGKFGAKGINRRFPGAFASALLLCGLASSLPAVALTVDDLNLIAVAGHGDLRLFKILLGRGVNPNALDQGNNSAVLMAAYYSKRDMVRQLIELQVDVNVLGSIGFTPVGVAAMRGDVEIVKMLIGAGAKLDVHDYEGETPLLRAIRARYSENLKVILGADANVDLPNIAGETPLMVAAQMGRLDYVEALLAKKADTSVKNSLGNTALYFAIFEGHDEIAKRLIQAGSTVRGMSNGYTILHWAQVMGRTDIVPLLVNAGAVN